MSEPPISIVFPVYNGSRYLRLSLESVLAQTFANFELIIWDDGSSDESEAIILSFQDERIRYFKNPQNRGLFPTLNSAIREARARWIRLWSQDDIMKPHCLEVELAFNHQHPEIGMSYCAVDYIDESGTVLAEAAPDATPEIITPRLAAQIMVYFGAIAGNIANVTLNRSVLDQVGLFREDLKVSGDLEMWIRISKAFPLGCIHDSLMYLRSHTGQFSRQRGIGITFLREDRPLFDELQSRVPPELQAHVSRYRLRQSTQSIQYFWRNVQTGELRIALAVLNELSRHHNVPLLFVLWALTLNNRLFRMKPRYALE